MLAEEADCLSHSVGLPHINMHIHKFQFLSFSPLPNPPPAPTLPVTRLFSHHVSHLIFNSKREVGLMRGYCVTAALKVYNGGKGTKKRKILYNYILSLCDSVIIIGVIIPGN